MRFLRACWEIPLAMWLGYGGGFQLAVVLTLSGAIAVYGQAIGAGPQVAAFAGNPFASIGAHWIANGSLPVLSSCGTGAANVGTDSAGHVVPGTGATSCTMTFAVPWTTRPSCAVTGEALTVSYALSQGATGWTTLTLSNALPSQRIHYVCVGRSGT